MLTSSAPSLPECTAYSPYVCSARRRECLSSCLSTTGGLQSKVSVKYASKWACVCLSSCFGGLKMDSELPLRAVLLQNIFLLSHLLTKIEPHLSISSRLIKKAWITSVFSTHILLNHLPKRDRRIKLQKRAVSTALPSLKWHDYPNYKNTFSVAPLNQPRSTWTGHSK